MSLDRPPIVTMIAGPNGSGKTTLTRWLAARGVEFGQYINPDDIAAALSGPYEQRVAEAQFLADRFRHETLESKTSFTFETVMSHPSKLEVLRRARERGFVIRLFFVGTEHSEVNVARVAQRVGRGGHDVPVDRIRQRWPRAMGMAVEACRLADIAYVFDNTLTPPDGPGLSLIAAIKTSADGKKLIERRAAHTPLWVSRFMLDPLAQ